MRATARRFTTWARVALRPPSGREVRRLLAGMCLAIALPRLPVVQELFNFAPLRFGPPEVYGILFLLATIGLLATLGARRLELSGRIAAGAAFVLLVTLAYASTSATSVLIDLMLAAAAFGEMVSMRHE